MRWLVVFLVFSAATASAQCEGAEGIRRAVIQHQGVDGIWFQLDVARCLLRDVEELQLRRTELGLLEARLRATDTLVVQLRESLSVQGTTSQELESALIQAREQIRPREWWESPFFWTPLALVLGAAAGVVVGVWAGR